MRPRYPIYVPSKGRWAKQLTSTHLSRMGVPHFVTVEEQERELYEAHRTPLATILVLPAAEYRARHETCDDFGDARSYGAGPARNFAWDHSIAAGAPFHWDVDDNIDGFFRLNWNLKTPVADGTVLRVMEAFVERYDNVGIAGPNYFMFASRKSGDIPEFVRNTRIYSCSLIRNDLPLRWRLRMNEDTDLSLRALKAGWCTVLFNAFLQLKMTTQTMAGGYNSSALYAATVDDADHEPSYHRHSPACENSTKRCPIPERWCCDAHRSVSTAWKSQMLVDQHPDVAQVVWRFHRWHHYVDYSRYRHKLRYRPGVVIPDGVDNFGMILERRLPSGAWVPIETPWDNEEATG